MASPDYFSRFPNIDYGVKINKAGLVDTIKIKDYFHLLTVRDDITPTTTIYEPYFVKNGERPDQVSYDYYGDEQYYWVILQINEIIDVHNEWPLSQYELDEYIVKKYGSVAASEETRHYETIEVKDKDGNVILPGRGSGVDRGGRGQNGLVVPGNYEFTYRDGNSYITRRGFTGQFAACTPISYRQYEYDLNEDKSQILVLQKKYIGNYMNEVKQYSASIGIVTSELDVGDL